MLVTMETLNNLRINTDLRTQNDELIQLILESLAIQKDHEIMNDLMYEIIQKNASLNVELQHKLIEIEHLSITDQLTDLYNRRRFILDLESEIARKKRYKGPFSVVMFDIDHFKSVNDTYGHDVGDHVLKSIAKVVTALLRESDVFARWGGEEFMILLKETTRDMAIQKAEEIREAIESHDFSPVPQVTSSFGVINVNDKEDYNLEMITKFVDQALYHAKDSGRNKVIDYWKMIDK